MLPAQPGRLEVRSLSARTVGPIFIVVAYRRAIARCVSLTVMALAGILLGAGCGAPGEPTPPSPPIPSAVSDLSAKQFGDGALLTFSLPGKTVDGKRLTESPACEIFRGTLKPDGSVDNKSFRVVYAIPGAMVRDYIVEKHVEFLDPLAPEEAKTHPGGKVAYLVRTRVSTKKASADSNIVSVAIFPVPQRIVNVSTNVAESAIELSWPAITQTSGGQSLGEVSYRVYRGQLNPPVDQAAIDAAVKDLAHVRWKSPLALVGSATTNGYQDTDFAFGATYVYVVRTVPSPGAVTQTVEAVESADSVPAVITPKDIFPPSAPQGLVAAVLEGTGGAAPVVELSWSISPESDVAGYRVYRSEREGERGEALASELAPTPAYRDTTVQASHRYWYSVTAVDRAGNESPAGAAVAAEIGPPAS
jgi:hypothetical protein